MTSTETTMAPGIRCRACGGQVKRRPETRLCGNCFRGMFDWIRDHGDANLREHARRNDLHPLQLFAMYIDARLRVEAPVLAETGWHFESTPTEERRHPTEEEMIATWAWNIIDAEVRYLRLRHRHRQCADRSQCPKYDYAGPVLAARFYGAQIVRRLG